MEWIKIFETPSELEAFIIKDVLEKCAVPTLLLNQKDTVYTFLGEISILVPMTVIENARNILTINGYLIDSATLN